MKIYLDSLEKEYQYKRKSILNWEKNIKKNHPNIWEFYKKIIKYKFYNSSKHIHNINRRIKVQIYKFLKEVILFNSDLDFIYDFQSFLGNCVLDDDSFKIIYYTNEYKNNKITQIISSKDDIKSYPVVYCGDDFDNSQDIQLLKDALDKLIQYEKYTFKKILDYNKKKGYKVTNRGTIEKIEKQKSTIKSMII